MLSFNALGQLGRLGNQMFQYAMLVALAEKLGMEFCIPPSANQDPYKDHQLLATFELPSLKVAGWHLHAQRVKEKAFAFDSTIEDQAKNGCDLYGYFQSEKYFRDQRAVIEKEFRFKPEVAQKCEKLRSGVESEIISLHVRRSDYLAKEDYHPTCTLEYYERALSLLPESPLVFVFSDDLDWCKQQTLFHGPRFFFSDLSSNVEDLCLMTLCDHHIVANSSFSWWGAWLGWTPTRKVIAPKNWFGPKGPQDTQDLVPREWISI